MVVPAFWPINKWFGLGVLFCFVLSFKPSYSVIYCNVPLVLIPFFLYCVKDNEVPGKLLASVLCYTGYITEL